MISKKCKYAIKALLYLADHQSEGRSIFSSEIAEQENIPKKFLETILRELRNFQFVQSKRGKAGGYKLLKEPKDINLADLMRAVDGPIAMLPCVSLNYYANCEECDEKICKIKPVFEEVRDKTLKILNATTIDKMAR
ncbi:Rrf2 family transcriptional regulator [Flavobacteriaceae bacterium]|jgi:Rrf2 family protein|uniref:RrF2 family transcriptional regulator n=1 Tax=Candidatus Arcticimaribacter forsetii TaxID=2820661 RepID=UPI0020779819|nr:Rrf2 family transcriptional regulator [Candidatus Arcticimaribacter forsetii]MDA8699320.1 Rrf2 family transcriptional regulator [Flavobacteriaceae bacterium]MDB2346146.1 Rrf2 family transcriptional regulator [Flavobacteriaceae bacterium]MDB2456584.1 Rrf2 family transcriptional regulator [Flavobacteriaceae bacterium]MDB4608480.1 Rrf2 family transcriptional regulator [Flavobacteriaceae bacterium]MDB4620583.1 Rrf2 family transcriptional regulator [Flavobacteriaceae bacterium]